MRLKATILFMLVSFTMFAQTDPLALQFAVSGTVIDSENGRGLQYVSVTIPGLKYTTVTNSDGGFTIKSSVPPEKLEFILLGYKTAIAVPPRDGSALTVRMERDNLTLEGALVIYADPYRIMDEAFRKVKDNFPDHPELLDCFYRETIRKRHRYIYVSEAVARLYKTSYSNNFILSDRITVDKSRLLQSPGKRDTLSVKVVGGPAQAVELDIVKNPDILGREDLSNYTMSMEAPETIDGRVQFAIRLIPSGETEYPLYQGVVYIDRETLAFTRFDLSLEMRDKEKVTRLILLKKPAGVRFTPTEVSVQYNYSMNEGTARLSYMRTVMRFRCDWKKRLLKTDFTAVSELVTTDRHSGDLQVFTRKEAFRKGEALVDKALLDFDPEFWKDYNIIEPTESLDRAIERIKKQTVRK